MGLWLKTWGLAAVILFASKMVAFMSPVVAGEFSAPWRDKSMPIILDAYEKNPIDWARVVTNKQIFGFIGKASDGLPPPWGCRKPNRTEQTLCKKTFQNYWLKKELYKTRRMVAKSLGLKWGAYHLGRPGNPIDQANHFVDFTQPDEDDLLALDIEHDNPKKWISLRDAETFVKHVKFRTGRYPVLYTNHDTAKRIAARRAELPVLSRLPLWYARYRSDIRGAFPMGHWESYAIWQFSAHPNCNKRRCLYRVAGTKTDIDVNVGSMPFSKLEKAWPFGGLLPKRDAPSKQNPRTLLVSAESKTVTASLVPSAKRKPITRFKTSLEMEDDEGKAIILTSVAVPSPRNDVASQLGFEVAALNEGDAIRALPAHIAAALEADFQQPKPPQSEPLNVQLEKVAHINNAATTSINNKAENTQATSVADTETSTKIEEPLIPLQTAAKSKEVQAYVAVKRAVPSYGYTSKRKFSGDIDPRNR